MRTLRKHQTLTSDNETSLLTHHNVISMGKNQHVVPHGRGWAVKGEGNGRATRVAKTQKEAIAHGRSIAKNQGSELVIHGKDGRIRDKDSFGSDPCPPRDTKH